MNKVSARFAQIILIQTPPITIGLVSLTHAISLLKYYNSMELAWAANLTSIQMPKTESVWKQIATRLSRLP